MKHALRWVGGGLAVALVLGVGLALAALRGLNVAADPDGAARAFEVRPGDTLASVARRLDDEGLLPRRMTFGPHVLVTWARLHGLDRAVKTGEYDLGPDMTPRQILESLVAGNVKTYPVTLPEGLRLDEVAARLEEAGICAADAFLLRARDAALARSMGIEAPSFEGYLYPETYRFQRRTDPEAVIGRMLAEFRSRLTEDDRARIAQSGLTLHHVVTLASIVEKETAVDAERALVAAVYRNRMKRGMRLQSDPTVIYGILETRGRFDGDIRFRDLREDNAWNTYTRTGLPPGPIASTSIASIRAVLEPADVPYLYFVSRNDGTHVFSKTLTEHSRAVDRYQKRRGSGS